MVNSATLIGRLGKDPEVRRLESGAVVAKITVATTEKYKDAQGQAIERTEWHNVVAWRGLAEVIEKYYKKGMLVFVEGKISTRKWQDSNGQDRWTTEIVANTSKILSRPGDSGGGYGGGAGNSETPTTQTTVAETKTTVPPAADTSNDGEDDLPF